jgi:hypothetical protein
MSPLKSLGFWREHNRLHVNFTFEHIFSITLQNFVSSLSVVQRAGHFRATYVREHFSDWRFANGFGSFSILSPLYGSTEVEIDYLTNPLRHEVANITHIALFFPGHSLATDQGGSWKLSNVCVDRGELKTFFIANVAIKGDTLVFASGRRLVHHPVHGKGLKDKEESCKKVDGSVNLFASPQGDDPLAMLRGVIGPIAQLRAARPGAQVLVVGGRHAMLEGLLKGLPNVEVLPYDQCRCFAEAIPYFAAVDDMARLKELYGWQKPGNSVVFLVDRGVTVRNAQQMAERMCHGCVADVVEIGSDDIAAKVGRASGVVVRALEDLGYGALLDDKAGLAVMTDKDIEHRDWFAPLAAMLRKNISIVRITRENNVIEIQ